MSHHDSTIAAFDAFCGLGGWSTALEVVA